jgi:predicted Fe-Mo cluster-binding NifX family protein
METATYKMCDPVRVSLLVENTARRASECAPISALVRAGARVVVTKSMGHGALRRCHEAGMQIMEASGRTVKELLNIYRGGSCLIFQTQRCARTIAMHRRTRPHVVQEGLPHVRR